MGDYKLYCLDGTRRIAGAPQVIRADSDEEAVAAAKSAEPHMACELWQGRRVVATWPARK